MSTTEMEIFVETNRSYLTKDSDSEEDFKDELATQTLALDISSSSNQSDQSNDSISQEILNSAGPVTRGMLSANASANTSGSSDISVQEVEADSSVLLVRVVKPNKANKQ